MSLKLRFLVYNMKMSQICCKDALRTREEVLLFFFFQKYHTSTGGFKSHLHIYSVSKGGHESQLQVLPLFCVTSQSLSSLICTSERMNKHMSLLHMLRRIS